MKSGCAETTRINSVPEGAVVYINGIHAGPTPLIHRYRAGLPESAIIDLRKEGYKNMSNATIDKSLRADASLFLLLLVIIPYFFSARFEDQYVFTLEPLPGTKVPPEQSGTRLDPETAPPPNLSPPPPNTNPTPPSPPK